MRLPTRSAFQGDPRTSTRRAARSAGKNIIHRKQKRSSPSGFAEIANGGATAFDVVLVCPSERPRSPRRDRIFLTQDTFRASRAIARCQK